MTFLGRDAIEVEALVTDRYLESLLAGHAPAGGVADGDAGASDSPARGLRRRGAPVLDASVRFAVQELGRDLPRFHPSFRFEERLAQRLGELATTLGMPAAAGAEGVIIPLRAFDPSAGSFDDPEDEEARRVGRPILIGSALTSAALSIAGVAWVAWRRSHPASTPMARAVRALNAARPRLD